MKQYIAAALTTFVLAAPASAQELTIPYDPITSIPLREEQEEQQRPSLVAIDSRRRINNLLRDDAQPLNTTEGPFNPREHILRKKLEERKYDLNVSISAFFYDSVITMNEIRPPRFNPIELKYH